MQCKRSPPTDSCSEYDPNSDSELEGDLSQCSSLVEESEADALSYSPIKVLALTFQSHIGRTYLAPWQQAIQHTSKQKKASEKERRRLVKRGRIKRQG